MRSLIDYTRWVGIEQKGITWQRSTFGIVFRLVILLCGYLVILWFEFPQMWGTLLVVSLSLLNCSNHCVGDNRLPFRFCSRMLVYSRAGGDKFCLPCELMFLLGVCASFIYGFDVLSYCPRELLGMPRLQSSHTLPEKNPQMETAADKRKPSRWRKTVPGRLKIG